MGFLVSNVSYDRRNVGSAYAVALSLVAPACPERSRRASCRLFTLSRCPSPLPAIPLALRYEGSAVEGSAFRLRCFPRTAGILPALCVVALPVAPACHPACPEVRRERSRGIRISPSLFPL